MTVYLHTFLQLLWAFFQCSAEAADPGIFGDRGDEVDSVMAVDVDGSFVGGAQTPGRARPKSGESCRSCTRARTRFASPSFLFPAVVSALRFAAFCNGFLHSIAAGTDPGEIP